MPAQQFALLTRRGFAPLFITQALTVANAALLISGVIAGSAGGVIEGGASGEEQRLLWLLVVGGLFLAPFFLLSASAGQAGDKFEKSRSIRRIKQAEIATAGLAAFGFWSASPALLLVAVMFMGALMAVLTPVKYALLPQVLRPEELTGGNGLVQAGALAAMFGGGMLAVFLSADVTAGERYLALSMLFIAVGGYLVARAVPNAAASAPELVIEHHPVRAILRTMETLRQPRLLLYAALGIGWFFFLSVLLLVQLPRYADKVLGGDGGASLLPGLFIAGVGIGALMCESLSRRTVEIGLVPLGAIGMSLFLTLLQSAGGVWVMASTIAIGLFGGLYVVPLHALIQQRAARSRLAQVIAAKNIIGATFVVLAAAVQLAWIAVDELGISQLFLLTAFLNAAVALYIFSLAPYFPMRFLAWLLMILMYRIKVRGVSENLPSEGPVLLVCNHVSYVDALVLSVSVPRPLRFVMHHKFYKIPVLRWLCRAAGAIPITTLKEDPSMMRSALERIDEALVAGEVVCIFPEGGLAADGNIGSFKQGIERILAARQVPVLPVALLNLWASMFSRRDSQLGRMRLPRRFRARIGVVAGPPLPAAEASSAVLEQRVRDLRGDAA